MKLTRCDRCGRSGPPEQMAAVLVVGLERHEWDACPWCLEDLKAWQRTKPDRPGDPLMGRPK